MADQVAKRLERVLAERADEFVCPECRRRTGGGYVLNPSTGYVCKPCDVAIRLSS